jgi:hypothetical protein
MRYVSWWYVGGAVATIAISITLGEIWSLGGLASIGVGWGGVIGIDIQDSRRRANDPEPRRRPPEWLVPFLTLLVTASFLAVGLFLTVAMKALWGEPEHVTAPLTTGAVLAVLVTVGVLALIHRQRRLRDPRTP